MTLWDFMESHYGKTLGDDEDYKKMYKGNQEFYSLYGEQALYNADAT